MGRFITSSLVTLCLFIIYHIRNKLRERNRARQQGCEPPARYHHRDPLFGLDLIFQTVKLAKANQNIIAVAHRFQQYGRTFRTTALLSTTVNTIEPENIQTIYASKTSSWGIEPTRLAAMSPFCGRGFITTDGPSWEHSRSLLKPSFTKANISDLTPFEAPVEEFLARIPSDGSTVDVQPLLYLLVSVSICDSYGSFYVLEC